MTSNCGVVAGGDGAEHPEKTQQGSPRAETVVAASQGQASDTKYQDVLRGSFYSSMVTVVNSLPHASGFDSRVLFFIISEFRSFVQRVDLLHQLLCGRMSPCRVKKLVGRPLGGEIRTTCARLIKPVPLSCSSSSCRPVPKFI